MALHLGQQQVGLEPALGFDQARGQLHACVVGRRLIAEQIDQMAERLKLALLGVGNGLLQMRGDGGLHRLALVRVGVGEQFLDAGPHPATAADAPIRSGLFERITPFFHRAGRRLVGNQTQVVIERLRELARALSSNAPSRAGTGCATRRERRAN